MEGSKVLLAGNLSDNIPAELAGHATIEPSGEFEAGSYTTITLVYTAGFYGIDDSGSASSGSVTVSVSPGTSRTLTAQQLEDGGDGLDGALGDGAGKWQLIVESTQPVTVMSLLASPTGHLTNLSTAAY